MSNLLGKEKDNLVWQVEKLGSGMLGTLDAEVGKTYENQRRLEAEAKNLENKSAVFSKDINKWMGTFKLYRCFLARAVSGQTGKHFEHTKTNLTY